MARPMPLAAPVTRAATGVDGAGKWSGCMARTVPYAGRGEVAEWSIAAVLKTAEVQASVGSNPTLSATGEIQVRVP